MVVILVVTIILAIGGGGYFLYKKRVKKPVLRRESDPQVLVKDDKMKEKLNELTEDPRVLFREFQQLETDVRNTV